MHSTIRKIAVVLLTFLFLTSSIPIFCEQAVSAKTDAAMSSTYEQYVESHNRTESSVEPLLLTTTDITGQSKCKIFDHYLNYTGLAVQCEEEGYVEYSFMVDTPGLYNISLDFCLPKGRHSAAERNIIINGVLPFSEASSIMFNRRWVNSSSIIQDASGNDIRPVQKEEEAWQEQTLRDSLGYYSDPLCFFFNKGKNTLRIEGICEPLIIGNIRLIPPIVLESYNLQNKVQAVTEQSLDKTIVLQGENASCKSDQTLSPMTDRSSPLTDPSSPSKIRLNIIGGDSYSKSGQKISWDFTIKKAGYYSIAVKWRQNIQRGITSMRRIYIDNKVPFSELNQAEFPYGGKWKINNLGNDKEDYLFYLSEGKHTISMEVTLGGMGNVIRDAQEALNRLNEVYRHILMLTGATPDANRDYNFKTLIPGDLEKLKNIADTLNKICDRVEDISGSRGYNVGAVTSLIRQCNEFSKKPKKIAKGFSQFKSNLGSLGTWIINMSSQPLEIDYLLIQAPNRELPQAEGSFFKSSVHELQMFLASFVGDYNSVADTTGITNYKNTEPLHIWITSGRDQAQIIKGILDDTFAPEKKIKTKIQLVQDTALLPATVAGCGPDLTLSTGNSNPVNYALRGAVVDLNKMTDYTEIEKRFYEESVTPYRYEGGVYALPVTWTFPVMFYRKDILEELNLKVPNTWEDVINMVSTLMQNHMSFTLPVSTSTTPGSGTGSFYMFLFQHGGKIYKDDDTASDLNSNEASIAFKEWTNFYLNYEFPLTYDFVNRFRLGETPIGIADLSIYNNLMVSAPEIKGLWDFTVVPGIKNNDGTVNHSVASAGSACMIFSSCKQKDFAWEVLKWWTNAETQTRFGTEMESLLGASARYATANKEAFSQLAWSRKEYKTLENQRKWAKGIPEVPGGYFTSRHIDNAFRRVTYYLEDPKDTLTDYVYTINQEITGKRKEFGLKYQN